MTIEFGYKSSTRTKSNNEGNYDASGDVAEGLINYSPYTPSQYWYFPVNLTFFADPNVVFGLQDQFRPLSTDLADFWTTKEEIDFLSLSPLIYQGCSADFFGMTTSIVYGPAPPNLS